VSVAVLAPFRSFSVMEWTGERIKALRKRLRLTQAEMAAFLGYDRAQSVSDLENDRREPGGPVLRLLDILDRHGLLETPGGAEGEGEGS
jgi:DNA-binding transcriptional regulator YiaG